MCARVIVCAREGVRPPPPLPTPSCGQARISRDKERGVSFSDGLVTLRVRPLPHGVSAEPLRPSRPALGPDAPRRRRPLSVSLLPPSPALADGASRSLLCGCEGVCVCVGRGVAGAGQDPGGPAGPERRHPRRDPPLRHLHLRPRAPLRPRPAPAPAPRCVHPPARLTRPRSLTACQSDAARGAALVLPPGGVLPGDGGRSAARRLRCSYAVLGHQAVGSVGGQGFVRVMARVLAVGLARKRKRVWMPGYSRGQGAL